MARLHLSITLAMFLAGACQPAAGPAGSQAEEDTTPQYLSAPGADTSNLPFSEVVRVGNVLYLSGRLGTVPGQGLPDGGIQPETRQALENIRAVLERHGSSMDRVIKCTVMLADMAEWGAMNEVYREFFPTNKPARSAFGTSGLAAGARVEIECMAAVS
jgi:2-iminobutanoate/2-iminopropanoate deaminase